MSWLSWLARSSLSLGTRLGTEAAAAGFQNCDAIPARNLAAKIHVRFGNSGMERNRRPRTTSPTIIVIRRSSLSASAPAIGPSSSAGSSVAIQTPPTAEFCSLLPWARFDASVVSARIDSQSPRLDSDSATHSARNGLMYRTPSPERARLTRRPGGPSPGLSLRGEERKFTGVRLSTQSSVPDHDCMIVILLALRFCFFSRRRRFLGGRNRLLGGRSLSGGSPRGARGCGCPPVGEQLSGALEGQRRHVVTLTKRRVRLAVGHVRA